ncbi:MAG: hypothetical protein ABR568_18575 [Pyrinomonadaceae bacterium]
MGREQMRNLDTSRIGAAQVNEFEYQKNQGELTEQQDQHPLGAKEEKRPTQGERVKQIMEAARKKVEKKRKKEAGATGKKSTTKSAAKSVKKVAGKTARKK